MFCTACFSLYHEAPTTELNLQQSTCTNAFAWNAKCASGCHRSRKYSTASIFVTKFTISWSFFCFCYIFFFSFSFAPKLLLLASCSTANGMCCVYSNLFYLHFRTNTSDFSKQALSYTTIVWGDQCKINSSKLGHAVNFSKQALSYTTIVWDDQCKTNSFKFGHGVNVPRTVVAHSSVILHCYCLWWGLHANLLSVSFYDYAIIGFVGGWPPPLHLPFSLLFWHAGKSIGATVPPGV